MRCFYHGEVEAVALCKSCSRAICHDCCADVGEGSACRGRCEPQVEALNKLIQSNQTITSNVGTSIRRKAYFYLAFGLLSLGLGLTLIAADEGPFNFATIFGAVLVLSGIWAFFSARQWRPS